jgi:hypothetical protein
MICWGNCCRFYPLSIKHQKPFEHGSKGLSPLTASANFGFRLTTAMANGWSILMEIFLFVVSLWGFILIGFAAVWGFRQLKRLNYFPAKP